MFDHHATSPIAQKILLHGEKIRLHDGRTLGYAEFSPPGWKTLFYFHGHPGSRVEAEFLAHGAKKLSVRLIGIDRPGMGYSTFQPNRRFLDWPDDVIELADILEINHFSVAGLSGGGPYALACAYKIPDRLTTCGIISGVGRISPFLSFLSQWLPWLMMPIVRRSFQNEEQAQKALSKAATKWIEPDRKSLLVPGIKELMAASLVEGLRQGTRGAAHEGTLLGQSWGFQLEEIRFRKIFLWHGELDKEVPVASAREVARKLPHCKATYYSGEGHISLIVNHASDILKVLT
jgi:pimeloyl-ACP methyl ester carboxylesterase